MKYIFTFLIATIFMSSAFSQIEKTVIVEHFTNTKCSTCASKNPALYEVLNDYPNVLHVAYHPSSPYAACIFSSHNPAENDARTNYYGIYGATPRMVLQGEVSGTNSPLLSSEQIENVLGHESDFSISIQHILTSENTIEVTITIERINGNGSEDMSFYALLVEKEIAYNAPNGEDIHHDVFRLVIDEQLISLANIGSIKTIVKTIDINNDWVPEEIVAIGILQDPVTKEVIQSAESTSATALFERNTNEVATLLYPNPVTSSLFIQPNERERFVSADVYSFLGSKMLHFTDINKMDMSGLQSGYYFVVLTDQQGKITTSKITKSH